MIRRGGAAALLGAAIALSACGGGGGGTAQVRAPTTTTTPPAGGGSVNVGIICSTPSDAAQTLVAAWRSADRTAARRCGSPAAVTTLFAHSGSGATWTFDGCAGTACSFSYPGGKARLEIGGSDAAGWIVARVQLGA